MSFVELCSSFQSLHMDDSGVVAKLVQDTVQAESPLPVVQKLLSLQKKIATSGVEYQVLQRKIATIENMEPFSCTASKVSHWLASLLAQRTAYAERCGLLSPACAFLVESVPMSEGWLGQLFPPEQDISVTRRMYSVLSSLLHGDVMQQLYQKMHGRWPEGFPVLSEVEKVAIACFTARALASEDVSCSYFRKKIYGLPRSIQLDRQGKSLFILFKEQLSEGGFKTITRGVSLSLTEEATILPLARGANQFSHKWSVQEVDLRRKMLRHELKLQERLYKVSPEAEGIWPIWHSCEFQKQCMINGELVVRPKISFVSPLAEGTFLSFFSVKRSFKEILQFVKQLCIGLEKLHKEGIVHGDLKPSNVLYGYLPTGQVKVGLIDFGFSFSVDAADEPQSLPMPFRQGYYGAVNSTSLELLENPPGTVDYIKAEMWALGYMLHRQILQGNTPWSLYVNCHYLLTTNFPEEVSSMAAAIENFKIKFEEQLGKLRRPLQGLPQKSLGIKSRLELLVLSLLSLDPNARPSCSEVIKELTQIEDYMQSFIANARVST